MTKAELVEKMAKDASVTKVVAKAALESFLDGVTKGLKKKKQQGDFSRFWNIQEGLSKNPNGT